jgi:hypothetical protein
MNDRMCQECGTTAKTPPRADEGGRRKSLYGVGIDTFSSTRPPQNGYYRMCERKRESATFAVMFNKISETSEGGRLDATYFIPEPSCDLSRPPLSTPGGKNRVHITEVIQ